MDRPDPQCNDTGDVVFLLQRQYRGYRNSNLGEVQQKAITPNCLRKVSSLSLSHLDVVICQLILGAWFFACRSCEYCTTYGTARRAKVLCLRNIHFFLGTMQLANTDPRLLLADTITLKFQYQKRDERDEYVTQQHA
jgi:hypothetical protein